MEESTKIAIVAFIGVFVGALLAYAPVIEKASVQAEVLNSLCIGIGYTHAADWELADLHPRVKCADDSDNFEWTQLYRQQP